MANVEVRGADKVIRMLSWYDGRELHNRLRRAVRAAAKPIQGGLKSAAASEPTGNVPDTFTKVPAAKVSSSARLGGDIVARIRPKSPLFNIFEPGADAHEIAPGAKGRMVGGLSGPGGQRWRGRSFYARGRVRHPGMKARPIAPTAFASKRRSAEEAAARVLFEPSGA